MKKANHPLPTSLPTWLESKGAGAALRRLDLEIESQLDRFCALEVESTHPPARDRIGLSSPHEPALEGMLFLSLARLLPHPLELRHSYPARFFVAQIEQLLGRPRGKAMSSILARAKALAPTRWAELDERLRQLRAASSGWSRWPASECRRAREALVAILPSWARAVKQVRRSRRKARLCWAPRDYATRRASHWPRVCATILKIVDGPRPTLGLHARYLLTILACFRANSTVYHDIFVFELASFVHQLWDREPDDLSPVTMVEQGSPARRKRIQRCRFRALARMKADDRWAEDLLPRLEGLELGGIPS